MAHILRFRKLCFLEPVKYSSCDKAKAVEKKSVETPKVENEDQGAVSALLEENTKRKKQKKQPKEWRCIDSCCWIVGYMCTTWWLLLFLFHCLPGNLPGLKVPEPPGARLKREGLTALHPVVLVPGIVTGGLELWEGKPCYEDLFRRRLWGGSFTEIFKRFGLHI
ncbi:Phospholipid:diacylglycerol acyltransferase 1 [Abeliophyllum distichum]|uniref:Phospholipid:diacylglycerol acyltransferase 1 n=1 Tax=Abeliophyllum distichum TaxID=126358 RepID=A0ABD1TEM1_9LAMI